jgi:hypothetical protein
MTVFSWTNKAGGNFDEQSNWAPPNSGIPGSDDSALFAVGGTYTVSMGGQDLIGISTSDNLTLRGPFNVSDSIGGSSNNGKTKTLKLEEGAVTVGSAISGDALILKEAAIIAGTVGNATSVSLINSSVTAIGATGGFAVDHKITILSSTVVSSFVSMGLSSNDGVININDSALKAVENGANTGLLFINGDAKLSSVKALAEVSLDVGGAIDWQGGTIKTDLLRMHESSSGRNDIELSNVTVKTHTVSGALNGAADPARLIVAGAQWENKSAFETSGTAIFRNADLQTGAFRADPEMGAGAEVTFSGSADLLVRNTAVMAELILSGGATATVGQSLSLVSGGEISGGGSQLKVGSLTPGGTLRIMSAANVTADQIEGGGGILIGQHSSLHAMGTVEKEVAISFVNNPRQAVLEIGKLKAFVARIEDFAPGARIRIEDIDGSAKISAEVHGGETELTFKVGKKVVGDLTLEGRFDSDDLRFAHQDLTAIRQGHAFDAHDAQPAEFRGQEDGGHDDWLLQ